MCLCVCLFMYCKSPSSSFEIPRLSLAEQDSRGALKVQSCDRMVLPAPDFATREVFGQFSDVCHM